MFENLVEAEFLNRPEDDDLAFLHFERLFRGPLDQTLVKLQDNNQDNYWDSYHHFMQTFINQVLATANQLNIDSESLRYWINNPSAANQPSNHQQIKFDIDAAITGIKVRYSGNFRKNSVHLTVEAREKIRDLVNKIKLTIEGVELPLIRKEALMGKLNAFASEVDRDRTRMEALGALIIEASGGAAKVERKLRPIRKWIDSIAGLMREARSLEDERPRLLAPDKRLSAAPKRIAPPDGGVWAKPAAPKEGGGLDDEIPF